jgi:hypothetical protein
MSTSEFRFEVAVSFAGDNKRDVIRRIMEILRENVGTDQVFFDEWFEDYLAGFDAHLVLRNIYLKQTRLVVSCICKRYGEKPWTQDEWRAIQEFERGLRDGDTDNVKRMRFLPLRFDDGELAGLSSTAIAPDVRNRSPEKIAELILKRLARAKSACGDSPATPVASESETNANGTLSAHPGQSTVRYGVPDLPLLYYARRRRNEAIGRLLWQRSQSRDRLPIAITGPVGVGKSVIIAAICRSNVIGAMFPKGIIWLDCLHASILRASLETALSGLAGEGSSFGEISDGISELQRYTHFRDTLIVLDNLDEAVMATAFTSLIKNCVVLVTTSNSKVVHKINCRSSQLRPFSLSDGVRLLKVASFAQPDDVEYLQFQSVVRRCGYLPSLIVEAGSIIRSEPNNWQKYLLADLNQPDGKQPHFSDRLFDATVSGLDEVESECFRRLVVFEPRDVVPESALETLWFDVTSKIEWQTILQTFIDKNLLRRVSLDGTFKIGVIHASTLRRRNKEITGYHSILVENYLTRFHSWQTVPFDGYFENRILDHLRLVQRDNEATAVAYSILACPNNIGANAARKCFEVLGQHADPQALTVLSATEDPLLQQACLLHLGSKARHHARRLLRKTTNNPLKALCVSLLGDEANAEADRLLKNNTNPILVLTCLNRVSGISQARLDELFQATDNIEVQIKCVRMMKDAMQQRCATALLSKSVNPSAIIECLKICKEVPVFTALALLESHDNANVRVACLQKIGKRDKIIARKFLREVEHDYVLCWCLGRLGSEARGMAKRLVRQPRGHQLICKCLRLLGKDGIDDAEYLLETSKDSRVLIASLRTLDRKTAVPFARNLLGSVVEGRMDSLIAVRCIDVLGSDAKLAARELINRDEKPEVLIACIDALGEEQIDRIRRIAQSTDNSNVIQKCLEYLQTRGIDIAREWQFKTKNVQLIRLCQKIRLSHGMSGCFRVLSASALDQQKWAAPPASPSLRP